MEYKEFEFDGGTFSLNVTVISDLFNLHGIDAVKQYRDSANLHYWLGWFSDGI